MATVEAPLEVLEGGVRRRVTLDDVRGPQGDPGPIGPGNLFVGPDAPVDPPDTYVWFEVSGASMTVWVEDGE